MSAKEKLNRAYLDTKINRILEPLIVAILNDKPEDHIQYMIDWLKEHHGNRASVHANERLELEFLQKEVRRLKEEAGEAFETNSHGGGSENESEGSEADEYVEDLPLPGQKGGPPLKPPRTSVSAEAYGVWNQKAAFKPVVVPKTEEVKGQIRKRLLQSFMFNALDEPDLKIVIDAMEEYKAAPGNYIIKQGEDGNNMFVVESGDYKCTRVMKSGEDPTYLKNYEPGEAFGELALLYNAPRAATIECVGEGMLYSLDRNTFNHIVKDASAKKREQYEEFLGQVKILASMEPYERSKLADAFKEERYEKDQYVLKEGEQGTVFYFIAEGEAVATKTVEAGKPPIEVMNYKKGDYFGERALIKNEPRAANVIAKSDLVVVNLDRHSFKRLLGPLEEILKRNMEIYNQYFV